MGRKTVKLPESDFEKHNERRKRLGMSWPEYMDEEAPQSLRQIIREAVRDELRMIFHEMEESDGEDHLPPE